MAASEETNTPDTLPEEAVANGLAHPDCTPFSKGRFQKLAHQWQEETEHLSSTTRIAAHPAYQEIIEMGWEDVPLILQELQKESHQ